VKSSKGERKSIYSSTCNRRERTRDELLGEAEGRREGIKVYGSMCLERERDESLGTRVGKVGRIEREREFRRGG